MKPHLARVLPTLILLAVLQGVCPPYLAAQRAKSERQVAEITDPGNGFDDQFGYSVGLSGNVLAVGAPEFFSSGAAYVYTNSGGKWEQAAELSPPSGFGLFGMSVAVSPDVIAVGSQTTQLYFGAVFVFVNPTAVGGARSRRRQN
jgi:hypothetical protein